MIRIGFDFVISVLIDAQSFTVEFGNNISYLLFFNLSFQPKLSMLPDFNFQLMKPLFAEISRVGNLFGKGNSMRCYANMAVWLVFGAPSNFEQI